ncbi:mandelate racemase/muconate lactonizing enzyme family protein [Agaribacter flavus]|uniref:Mandelate racemase/muconate lactonizing enzyme family protein n=1 Tax=Agaribacter flavus TaxID=1902781 RepID=A0ABV7FK68_9ALTE
MKITDVKAYAFWAGFRNVCVVKVETDEGIYGWGESGLSGREKAVMGAIEHFRQFLIGQDAFNIGGMWQEMYRSQYFERGRVLSAAIAAIDIALYDVKGKALGVPVYQLLGGKQRNQIPLFATSIKPHGREVVDDAIRLYQEGWQCIRLTTGEHGDSTKPTRYEPRDALPLAADSLNSIREELGNKVVLGIDFHHRLSVAETVSFTEKLAPGTLDFLEEPIRAESPEAYKMLRQMTNVPFAIGEEFTSKWHFAPFVESNLTNFARIDVCNAGGFTESMKIAAMCEAHYIDMMPHNPLSPLCTAASIHFCAAINNLSWLEILEYTDNNGDYDRYFVNAPVIENNMLQVLSVPGLGIDVNEELVKEQSFKFWEAPRLHKDDGSYTNW